MKCLLMIPNLLQKLEVERHSPDIASNPYLAKKFASDRHKESHKESHKDNHKDNHKENHKPEQKH